MTRLKRPRGTRDQTPESMAVRRHVEERMRATLKRYAYREVQTPVFEHLELFTAKSGPAIMDELYAFKDKAGRDLALRPELTAAVMRLYHEELSVAPKPVRLAYHANCFRYDRPQEGRYREFWQVGCELIGSDTPEANAEIIALCIDLLRGAGLNGLVLRIGHIAILDGVLAAVGAPHGPAARGPLTRAIDKRDEKAMREELAKAGVDGARGEDLLRLASEEDNDRARDQVRTILASGTGEAVERAQTALAELEEALAAFAAFTLEASDGARGAATVRFDPLIARGLDYYTGVVFEVDAPWLGAEKQLAGGGSYDLSGVFGTERIATAGFALGFDRALVALEKAGLLPDAAPRLDVYVAPIGDLARVPALRLVAALRAAGLSVEVDLMRRAPGKNLKAADTRNARWAVLLGEKEIEKGMASVKELASGEQEELPLGRLAAELETRRDRAGDPAPTP